MEGSTKRMHWSQRPGLMVAIGGLLAMLGAALVFFEDRATELGASAAGMGLLHAVTAVCFLAGVAVWCWAVALEVRPGLEPREAAASAAAMFLVVLAAGAGAFAGSQIEAAKAGRAHPPAAFAHQLENLLTGLAQEHKVTQRQLARAKTRAKQSVAAARLSDLYSGWATRLDKAAVSGEQWTPRKRIATALRSVAQAYAELAAAVGNPSGSQKWVDRRRRRVHLAESAVHRELEQLAAAGYAVVVRD